MRALACQVDGYKAPFGQSGLGRSGILAQAVEAETINSNRHAERCGVERGEQGYIADRREYRKMTNGVIVVESRCASNGVEEDDRLWQRLDVGQDKMGRQRGAYGELGVVKDECIVRFSLILRMI